MEGWLTMNTTHLESFVYVAKYNSISKAAQQLNYSSSTVQSHIKALEEEFDTKLYDRTSSGVQLTISFPVTGTSFALLHLSQ